MRISDEAKCELALFGLGLLVYGPFLILFVWALHGFCSGLEFTYQEPCP